MKTEANMQQTISRLIKIGLCLPITLWLLGLIALGFSIIGQAESLDESSLTHNSERNSSVVAPTNVESQLVLFNRNVVTFYTDLLGMSPQKRAARAELVIKELLTHPEKLAVTTATDPLGTLVKLNDNVVFIISNDDVAMSHALNQEEVVQQSVEALKQVVLEKNQSGNVEFMTRASIKASAAVLIFVGLVWLLMRFKRTLEQRFLKVAHEKKLHLGGAEEHLRTSIVRLVQYAIHAAYWLVLGLFTYEVLSFVLEQFPYTRAWGEQLNGYLIGLASHLGSAILHAIPDLFTALIIFMLARFVSQITNRFFDSVATGQTKLQWVEQDVAGTTKRIVNVVVWLFAFVMAYPYLPGSGSEAFKGVSVLVGLMLSLGASSLVNQAGSGLILTYTRTFRRGDYVSIGENEGTVMELGLFNTRIRNGMGVELAIPNSYILNEVTRNYSRTVHGAGFVVDASVTIGYDTPWRQVEAMLLEAAVKTPGVLAEPPPKVFQTALSDFYPEYRLVCQAIPADARQRAEVMSALHANIQDVFNTYEVQIMSPQYYEDPAIPKVVPEGEWFRAPAKPPQKK
jgi:small-conductance mechanosensitive channel